VRRGILKTGSDGTQRRQASELKHVVAVTKPQRRQASELKHVVAVTKPQRRQANTKPTPPWLTDARETLLLSRGV
jgi:hypothetical protein